MKEYTGPSMLRVLSESKDTDLMGGIVGLWDGDGITGERVDGTITDIDRKNCRMQIDWHDDYGLSWMNMTSDSLIYLAI